MLKQAGFVGERIVMNWDVADVCNIDCSYCYNKQTNHDHTIFTQNQSVYKTVLARLATINEEWDIDIQGGEPMLHPNIQDIVSGLASIRNCGRIVLATNLTQSIDSYAKLRCEKLSIHASYHPEYSVKWAQRFIKYYDALGPKFFVEVIAHPDPKYTSPTIEFINAIEQHNIPFGVTLLHSTDTFDCVYSTEVLDAYRPWITADNQITKIPHVYADCTRMYGEHEIYERGIKYTNMVCDAKMFTIMPNGNIINTCSKKKQTLRMSNIQPIVCERHNTCECSQMLRYMKRENS